MVLIITLLCAVGAAVLRGFQLARSFTSDQLIHHNDALTIALMALCGAFLVCAFLYVFLGAKKKRLIRTDGFTRLGTVWLCAEILAAAVFFAAAVGDLINGFQDMRVSVICLGFLGLLASVSVLLTALSANRLKPGTATGFWFTIPVYWCCFLLFVDFTSFAGNPIRNAFMYGMLASVFCTLALNAAAGMFFGKTKQCRMIFFSSAATFFAALTLGGSLAARFILRPETLPDAAVLTVPNMLRLAFVALHTAALLFAVQKGWLEPKPEEDVPETEETEDTVDTEDTERITPSWEEPHFEGGEPE